MTEGVPVEIRLCGELRIEVEGVRVEQRLTRRRSRQLLALLALRPRGVGRSELIELLWPEEPPEARDVALRQLVCELRSCLGAELIPGREQLTLMLPAGSRLDVRDAERAVVGCLELAAAQRWAAVQAGAREVLGIVSGPLLAGEQAAWLDRERDALEELELTALELLAAAQLHLPHRVHGAERAARRLTWLSPYREQGHVLLMQALIAGGNPAQALVAYERVRDFLRTELGTAPCAELRALHMQALTAGDDHQEMAS